MTVEAESRRRRKRANAAELRRRMKRANAVRWRQSPLGRLTNAIGKARHLFRATGTVTAARRLVALEAERERLRATRPTWNGPDPAWQPELKTAVLSAIDVGDRPTLSKLAVDLGWPRSTVAARLRVLETEWKPGEECQEPPPDEGAPTPREIAERVAAIRKEKGLPEVGWRT